MRSRKGLGFRVCCRSGDEHGGSNRGGAPYDCRLEGSRACSLNGCGRRNHVSARVIIAAPGPGKAQCLRSCLSFRNGQGKLKLEITVETHPETATPPPIDVTCSKTAG